MVLEEGYRAAELLSDGRLDDVENPMNRLNLGVQSIHDGSFNFSSSSFHRSKTRKVILPESGMISIQENLLGMEIP